MIKIKLWPTTETINQQFFKREKIYFIVYIIKKAHIILAIAALIEYWFFNNYIDSD